MDFAKEFNSKTAIEHLASLEKKTLVEVCRALDVTTQQFSDWIKHRRPIPQERLQQLERYFQIPSFMLADENRFAKLLSIPNGIELEIVFVKNQLKSGPPPEEKRVLKHWMKQLRREKQKQARVTRLSNLLDTNDPSVVVEVDAFLDRLDRMNGNKVGGYR